MSMREIVSVKSNCHTVAEWQKLYHSAILEPFNFLVLVILFPWFLNKTTSLNTKQKRIPFWAFSWLFLNMSLFAAAGAVSLKSMTLASWRLLLYTNIIPPPPIPDECILTTPKQNMAAIAASTAEPLALRMSLPIWEHWGVSVAMACLS